MRKVLKKKSLPLKARFGIKPEVAIPHIQRPDTSVVLDVGWMTLYFGPDERSVGAVLAVTKNDSFLLCAEPPTVPVTRSKRKRRNWVYAVDRLPTEEVGDRVHCRALKYCGFEVTHGSDAAGRDFLSLVMPPTDLRLLFRNPDSKNTEAWSARRALAMDETMAVEPHDNAMMLEIKRPGFSTGDAELDRLLKELG